MAGNHIQKNHDHQGWIRSGMALRGVLRLGRLWITIFRYGLAGCIMALLGQVSHGSVWHDSILEWELYMVGLGVERCGQIRLELLW